MFTNISKLIKNLHTKEKRNHTVITKLDQEEIDILVKRFVEL